MALGEPNPDAMLARMTPTQLGEWLALYRIDPWDQKRADLRVGILGAKLMAGLGATKKSGGGWVPADFMPVLDPDAEPEEAPDLAAKIRAFFSRRREK